MALRRLIASLSIIAATAISLGFGSVATAHAAQRAAPSTVSQPDSRAWN